MYLTIDEIIKNNPININILNDNMLNEMKSFGVPEIPKNFNDALNDLKDCENWNMANIKAVLKSIKQLAKETYINAKNNIENQINDLINNFNAIFKNIWETIKDTCYKIYEELKNTYNAVIAYFKGEFQKIINIWKKIKSTLTSKEEKDKLKQQLIITLKEYGNDILEMFGIFVLIDVIEIIWNILKNIWGFSRNKWREFISTLKESREMLDSNELKETRIAGFITLIKNIIPSIGLLGVTILSIIDCRKAEQRLNEITLEDAQKNNKPITNKNIYSSILNNIHNNIDFDIDDNSINNINNIKNISICPVYDDINVDTFTNNGTIIEIGTDIQDFKLDVELNQIIKSNDNIGNIKNNPIKSIIDGTVIKKTDRYIIIKNTENKELQKSIEEYSISALEPDKLKSPEIDKITNAITSMNNIENIFKDYLKFLYKPIIFSNLYNKSLNISDIRNINDDIKDANKTHNEYIDKFNENVKSICNVDRVKTLAENNQINIIKDEIINEKESLINNIYSIVTKYYNINNNHLIYNIINYNMCDDYLLFLMENIDNDNTHLIKLYEFIKSLYIKRFNYESKNINSLITKFNNKLKDYKIYNINYSLLQSQNINTYDHILSYFNNLENFNLDDNNKKILSNLYTLINDIKNNKGKTDNTDIKKLTFEESEKIKLFIDDLHNEYKNCQNILNNIDNIFNSVNWPVASELYIDNKKYTHYLFTENTSYELSQDEKDDIFSGKTEHEISSINYWLKYCAMATLENCLFPVYWSTGLIVLGVPIPMPIILVPIKYIQCGDIGALLGLGICGISIYPMLLMINTTLDTQSIMIPINIILATMRKILQKTKDIQIDSIKMSVQPMIDTISEKIKRTKADIKLLDDEILTLKSMEV